VSFNYSGIGTSRFLFGQVVDKKTGLVLGTLVTPIPVTLNGKSQTATISLADVAWTSTAGADQLQIQLTTSASAFWNFTSFGTINITGETVTLPVVDNTNVTTLPPPPV
jgi:ABC-2 type transport system ATP-binding protein